MYRLFLFVCAIAVSSPTAWCKAFNFRTDTFAFANQTYFDYKPLSDLQIKISRRKGYLPDYSRHCFQLVRAVLQFYQFAEFRPDLPKVSESDYRKIVRRVCQNPSLEFRPERKSGRPRLQRSAQLFLRAHQDAAKKYGSLVAILLESWQLANRFSRPAFRAGTGGKLVAK